VVVFALLFQSNSQAQTNKAIGIQIKPGASNTGGKLTFAQLRNMVIELSGKKASSVSGIQDSKNTSSVET